MQWRQRIRRCYFHCFAAMAKMHWASLLRVCSSVRCSGSASIKLMQLHSHYAAINTAFFSFLPQLESQQFTHRPIRLNVLDGLGHPNQSAVQLLYSFRIFCISFSSFFLLSYWTSLFVGAHELFDISDRFAFNRILPFKFAIIWF